MKTTGEKKISLVRSAVYSIVLELTILLGQIYLIIKNMLPAKPIFIGPVYVPLFLSSLLLVLLIVVGLFVTSRRGKTEATDELADFNKYKAGYIAKYISVFAMVIAIILIRDFNIIMRDDFVGFALCIFVISISFMELVHNIVFIILEKR